MSDQPNLGLGIDAGGTQTRWSLARGGAIVATGSSAALTALSMGTEAGRARMREVLDEIAAAVLAVGSPTRIVAGLTGFDDGPERDALAALVGGPFGLAASAVTL